MNKKLTDFEAHTGLGATYAAKLLGIAYTTYAPFKRGTRPLPDYIERSIESMTMLPPEDLNSMIKRHVLNGK